VPAPGPGSGAGDVVAVQPVEDEVPVLREGDAPSEPAPYGGLDIAPDEHDDTHRCPTCFARYPLDQPICTNCGIDIASGDSIVDEDDEPEAQAGLGDYVRAYLPGLSSAKVVIVGLVLCFVSVGIGVVGLVLLAFGAMLPAITILGFGLIVWGHAVGWLVYGDLAFLPKLLAELDKGGWMVFLALWGTPILLWFTALGVFAPD